MTSKNTPKPKIDISIPMPCGRCKGEGTIPDWKDETKQVTCYRCKGNGAFPPLNTDTVNDILDLLISKRGKTKGQMRKSRPAYPEKGDSFLVYTAKTRAYYIWRLARFHGGADVCLPICAEMDIKGDPARDALDTMAEIVARKTFGTDLAGAYRWGNALGYSLPPAKNLPASAESGGPVADEFKPEEELAELL